MISRESKEATNICSAQLRPHPQETASWLRLNSSALGRAWVRKSHFLDETHKFHPTGKQVAQTEAFPTLFLETARHLSEIHRSLSCFCLLKQGYPCPVSESPEVTILLPPSLRLFKEKEMRPREKETAQGHTADSETELGAPPVLPFGRLRLSLLGHPWGKVTPGGRSRDQS